MKQFNLIFLLLIIFNNTLFAQDSINLTPKETIFLKKHSPLKIHNELNWPPYNYNENGEPKGFSIDYMNLLAKKLNIKLKYVTGPSWDQFMKMLQDGEIDAIINISKNKEREKHIAFYIYFSYSSKCYLC